MIIVEPETLEVSEKYSETLFDREPPNPSHEDFFDLQLYVQSLSLFGSHVDSERHSLLVAILQENRETIEKAIANTQLNGASENDVFLRLVRIRLIASL
ncbi:hypothetical protein HK096_011527, partial [Nowakowskiella sp. JEL0078]